MSIKYDKTWFDQKYFTNMSQEEIDTLIRIYNEGPFHSFCGSIQSEDKGFLDPHEVCYDGYHTPCRICKINKDNYKTFIKNIVSNL